MNDPSRALTRYDGPRTVADLERYAMTLAVNTLPDGTQRRNDALPAIFRGNPAAVAFAVEYAKALDVSPITAVIGIHIVDGKPTASAGLISALVRRAGHRIRTFLEGSIAEGTAKGVTTITRADDPDFEYRSEWTLDRAERAGLMRRTPDGRYVAAKERSAWATYPENMLKARSLTECARDAAEDAILGVHYTPEELGVDVDETGEPVYTVTQVPPPAETPRTSPSDDRTAATGTSPEGETTSPDLDAMAAAARESILAASSLADLVDVWNGPEIDAQSARADALTTADENGQETTILLLFRRAADAIKSGRTLDGRDVPGDDEDDTGGTTTVTPDGDAGDTGSTPQEAAQGREVTLDEATAKVVEGEVVDAKVVEGGSWRDALDRILRDLGNEVVPTVVAWCRDRGLGPDQGEEACHRIVLGIQSGEALPAAHPEDPVDLVRRVLGATVLSNETVDRRDTAEMHRREMAERRAENAEDAARATAAGHGPKGSGKAAFDAARAQSGK